MQDALIQGLEHKFRQFDTEIEVQDGARIEGYASYFGRADQGGDIVSEGAYAASLKRLADAGRSVKFLWQHDPAQPIGLWEEVREDSRGLYVRGRILPEVARGREAIALIDAGAIDGLSIGYRTVRSGLNEAGQRTLSEIELWEVSLVTFPMLPDARIGAKAEAPETALFRDLAGAVEDARRLLAATD